jgi:predicted nucleic acid-binding protein
MYVSAITVMERMRGYALLIDHGTADQQARAAVRQEDYRNSPGEVLPVDATVALFAGELAAMLPQPPTPLKPSHRLTESRQDRLFRWRCEILIAATALTADLPLVHNNPADFETIRMAIEIDPRRFPGLGPLNLILAQRLA